MCIICDGATPEEALDGLHDKIKRFGWAYVYVEPSPGNAGWGYTVGLTERLDHPELVVVGLDVGNTALLLHSLVSRTDDGERFGGQSLALLPDRSVVRFVPVHPTQLTVGVMAQWNNVYDTYGPFDLEQRALQVLPCGAQGLWHSRPVPRLDRATTVLAAVSPRAAASGCSRHGLLHP
jgi:uncharacterized protein DUF4262